MSRARPGGGARGRRTARPYPSDTKYALSSSFPGSRTTPAAFRPIFFSTAWEAVFPGVVMATMRPRRRARRVAGAGGFGGVAPAPHAGQEGVAEVGVLQAVALQHAAQAHGAAVLPLAGAPASGGQNSINTFIAFIAFIP